MAVRRLAALLKSLSSTNADAAAVAGGSLASGRIVHAKSITLSLHTDPILCRALVGFYPTFDLAHLAIRLLDSAPSDDVSPWNAFLSACSKRHLHAQAFRLLRKLLLLSPSPKPDAFTYPSALKACAGLGAALDGEFLHASV
ncbi:hypothetical protein ZIOFF_064773 [Zingiber officinale]|uniref:Pentatricopeptide repeat-containing protein n=1 Tax=Zingiber officinale TaxID=94328 RepID=A0A8J5K8H1_ZINOF|nr:hypothetical protein ZIOFF_064773 [Zingiber officinale]